MCSLPCLHVVDKFVSLTYFSTLSGFHLKKELGSCTALGTSFVYSVYRIREFCVFGSVLALGCFLVIVDESSVFWMIIMVAAQFLRRVIPMFGPNVLL